MMLFIGGVVVAFVLGMFTGVWVASTPVGSVEEYSRVADTSDDDSGDDETWRFCFRRVDPECPARQRDDPPDEYVQLVEQNDQGEYRTRPILDVDL